MIFVGVDWAEIRHDVCVLDRAGEVLARKKIPDTIEGARTLHELLAPYVEEPDEVLVGIEKDRGLIVTAMLGAGYRVYALNPMSVARLSRAPRHLGIEVRSRRRQGLSRRRAH